MKKILLGKPIWAWIVLLVTLLNPLLSWEIALNLWANYFFNNRIKPITRLTMILLKA